VLKLQEEADKHTSEWAVMSE